MVNKPRYIPLVALVHFLVWRNVFNQKLSDCSLLCISTGVLLSRILNGHPLKYTLR